MQVELTQKENRSEFFEKVGNYLADLKLRIASKDFERPWGGFYVIDEAQAQQFSKLFFPAIEFSDLQISGKLSPKILMVSANKRLSWQYHHRRAEIWKLIGGTAGVITSSTDEQGSLKVLKDQEIIQLPQGQRHRLVGVDGWGVIAEIWRHTDSRNPSDESDIVRLQDDFGR